MFLITTIWSFITYKVNSLLGGKKKKGNQKGFYGIKDKHTNLFLLKKKVLLVI